MLSFFCSLAPWLAVINLYITLQGDVTKVWVHVGSSYLIADALVYISIPVFKFACRTTVVLLRGSSYTVFDLLVNCLGGPVIDTWDGDWILSPAPKVWQLTPSLLITSFTQATGLLCLGPHNTTFSYWDFFLQFSQSFCFHTSIVVVIEHLSCESLVNVRWLTALAPHELGQASTCHLNCARSYAGN